MVVVDLDVVAVAAAVFAVCMVVVTGNGDDIAGGAVCVFCFV